MQQALIDRGANVNAVDSRNNTALILASEAGHVEAVEVGTRNTLAQEPASAQTPYQNRIHLQIASHWLLMCVSQVLLRRGANPNLQNGSKTTALIYAANTYSNLPVVEVGQSNVSPWPLSINITPDTDHTSICIP